MRMITKKLHQLEFFPHKEIPGKVNPEELLKTQIFAMVKAKMLRMLPIKIIINQMW